MSMNMVPVGMETKAWSLILPGPGSYIEKRRYVDREAGKIARAFRALWKKQAQKVTTASAEEALSGRVPPSWEEAWARMAREFVRDDMVPQWQKAITESGEKIARRVNILRRKQFDFDSTKTATKGWVDQQGGKLIVSISDKQMKAVNAALNHQISHGVTSPYNLAQRIKPIVGLTEREALAVSRFTTSLAGEGLTADQINKQAVRYSNYLHNNRAMRIARTETSDAYNFGQMDSLRQARDADMLPGIPEKNWVAGGADPCEICLDNEAAGWIPLDGTFPSGDDAPTAHPGCECAVSYRVRRDMGE